MPHKFVSIAFVIFALITSACTATPKSPSAPSAAVGADNTPSIAEQVQPNWYLGSLADAPELDKMIIRVHVSLLPDGTITNVTYDNDHPDDPNFRRAAESAKRAVIMTKKLQLPPGKTFEKITFEFRPADIQ